MPTPMPFDQEIANVICDRIAEGESLRKICTSAELPSRETVRKWLREDEGFAGQYARAREEQADYYADKIIEIADEAEDPQKARVQIDARKWVASKLKPKVYGDRIQQDVTINELDGLTGSQLDGRLAAVEAAIDAEARKTAAADGEEQAPEER